MASFAENLGNLTGKTILDFNKARDDGSWHGTLIGRIICKQSTIHLTPDG